MCSTGSHFLFVKDILHLWYSNYFLLVAVERFWKHKEDKKNSLGRNKKAADRFPRHNDTTETGELNEKADKVKKPEDAVDISKKNEEILRTKRKGIISVAHHQGKVFSRFRQKEKFAK